MSVIIILHAGRNVCIVKASFGNLTVLLYPDIFSKYLLAEFEVTRTTKVLRHRFMDHGSTVMKSTIQVAVDNSDRSLLLLLLLL